MQHSAQSPCLGYILPRPMFQFQVECKLLLLRRDKNPYENPRNCGVRSYWKNVSRKRYDEEQIEYEILDIHQVREK